jgi:hypothetical protein
MELPVSVRHRHWYGLRHYRPLTESRGTAQHIRQKKHAPGPWPDMITRGALRSDSAETTPRYLSLVLTIGVVTVTVFQHLECARAAAGMFSTTTWDFRKSAAFEDRCGIDPVGEALPNAMLSPANFLCHEVQ